MKRGLGDHSGTLRNQINKHLKIKIMSKYPTKNYLQVGALVLCILAMWKGFYWGDEYHAAWYGLLVAGILGFVFIMYVWINGNRDNDGPAK
jgi:hypothetical protein